MKPFYIVVKNLKTQTFRFEGPMTDDGPTKDSVLSAQQRDQKVICHTVHEHEIEAVRKELEVSGWTLSLDSILLKSRKEVSNNDRFR